MFMQKVREAMKSNEDFPMTVIVNVENRQLAITKKASPAEVMTSIRKKRYAL